MYKNSLITQKSFIDGNTNDIERVLVRSNDVFVKRFLKLRYQVVPRGDSSGISLSYVDAVKPNDSDVDNFIHSITMVTLVFSIGNTLDQNDIHVFGNLNNFHLQNILNISMYVEVSSLNAGRIRFGYSLSDDGNLFDGYPTFNIIP